MQGILGTIILFIVIFTAALLAVGIIDGNRFVTVKEEFRLPGLSKECKFVLISDLHNKVYGNRNDKVIDAVKMINPDFIILAGDLVTSKAGEDMTPGIELVKALSRDYRIYYGLGNHESKLRQCPDKFGDKFDRLKSGVQDKNVILLENDAVDVPEFSIRITGLDLDLKYFAHFRIRKMEDGYLQKTLPEYDKTKCNLLIAHNPVHGGIMRLPFLGGVIAPSYKIFPKYDGGVFKTGKSVMLLGRGMGSHTIPFRFFNPAELYEVTLRQK